MNTASSRLNGAAGALIASFDLLSAEDLEQGSDRWLWAVLHIGDVNSLGYVIDFSMSSILVISRASHQAQVCKSASRSPLSRLRPRLREHNVCFVWRCCLCAPRHGR